MFAFPPTGSTLHSDKKGWSRRVHFEGCWPGQRGQKSHACALPDSEVPDSLASSPPGTLVEVASYWTKTGVASGINTVRSFSSDSIHFEMINATILSLTVSSCDNLLRTRCMHQQNITLCNRLVVS